VGNIKESVIPYAKKHFKMAQLSFDRYGALSPTENKQTSEISNADITANIKKFDGDTKDEEEENENGTTSNNDLENKGLSPRSFSQVECESSAPKYDGTFEDYLEMFIQF
jgi:hypothetical protein